MAKKHIHSQDPRKAAIVAALKRISGGTKVTLLVENLPNPGNGNAHLFTGRCLKSKAGGGFESLGEYSVDARDVSQADYDPSPYCSYGHMTKASCDCGPIARNE